MKYLKCTIVATIFMQITYLADRLFLKGYLFQYIFSAKPKLIGETLACIFVISLFAVPLLVRRTRQFFPEKIRLMLTGYAYILVLIDGLLLLGFLFLIIISILFWYAFSSGYVE
jgi:hypothetical protein